MKKSIAITGGIASGKSVISSKIKELGYKLEDCDLIAHLLYEDSEVIKEIAISFDIKESEVKRENISKIVFNDNDKLKTLNNIMHERIINIMQDKIDNNDGILFFDVPLLFELDLVNMFDNVIFVYANSDKQISRLMQRDNITKDYAMVKISKQISLDDKLKRAKKLNAYVINNSYTLDRAYQDLENIIKEIVK